MKIMIINPNSTEEATRGIQETAESYAAGAFEVTTVTNTGAPQYIDYYTDQALAAPGMVKLIKDNENEYDAFIIACHCDPNLDLLKQITDKPVIGIGEASMKLATMLGHSFSVVSSGDHSIPNKCALVHKYSLDNDCASVRGPRKGYCPKSFEDAFHNAASAAVKDDLAEVVVLGCAGFPDMPGNIADELGVPVLEGVVCALIIAEGFVKAGYATSKIRRYKSN